MNWNELLARVELALRAGRVDEAARWLKGTPRVPRAFAAEYAQAARRAQLDHLSLRTLNRYVRSDQRLVQPSPRELIEYAASLQKIGAVHEARTLLAESRADAEPLSHLYRAFAHFRVWEYRAAIPHLERYLTEDLTAYARLLGELNLAAALVTTAEVDRARVILDQIKTHAEASGSRRILINAREVEAQLNIQVNDFAAARADLRAASALGAEANDAWWIEKWTAVLAAEETGDLRPLARFRRRARQLGDWESVRDADYHRLRMKPSTERLHHLIFGTPYADYHRRVLARVNSPVADEWRYGTPGAPIFDLSTGNVSGASVTSPTNGVHRTLAALVVDLYRPARVGDLFDRIFAGEHYDPNSSANRVHQALARARGWIERERLPMTITEDHGAFRLRLTGPFALRLTRERGPLSNFDVQLNLARATFGERWFSPSEARAALKVSTSALKRVVAAGLAVGRIERLGSGRAILYKLCG